MALYSVLRIMSVYEPGVRMSFEKSALPHPDDTIVAVSSAPGPGARAVVRVSGAATRTVVEAVFSREGPNPPTPFPKREGGEVPPLQGEGLGRGRLLPGSLRLSSVHSPLPAVLYF